MEFNLHNDEPLSFLPLNSIEIEKSQEKPENSFICQMCFRNFDNPLQLREHLMEEFEFESDSVPFLDLELGIEMSTDYSTAYSSGLKVQEIASKLNCPVCQRPCKNSKGLEQHKAKAHNHRKKKVLCKLCGKTYKHKYALRFHISQVHEKATRVECKICGKENYNKYMLALHLKEKHSELSSFSLII